MNKELLNKRFNEYVNVLNKRFNNDKIKVMAQLCNASKQLQASYKRDESLIYLCDLMENYK